MGRRRASPPDDTDLKIGVLECLHVPMALPIEDKEVPCDRWCIEVAAADTATDERLWVLLRGLRDRSRERGKPRLDELVLAQAPEIAARLDAAASVAIKSFDDGQSSGMRDLLVECPAALLWPRLAGFLADRIGDRTAAALLKSVGEELARRKKASPRRDSLRLRDSVDLRRLELERQGHKPALKELLADVGDFVGHERQLRRRHKSATKAPQVRFILRRCSLHFGLTGLQPCAEPP